MTGNTKDLTGKRFGRLVVLEDTQKRKDRRVVWKCKCDCGNECEVISSSLLSGRTQSCGCLMNETRGKSRITHHKSNSKLYQVFHAMKKRCYNANHNDFQYYGGRGIRICDEWLNDFEAFYDWAIANGYKEGLTIERIDVDGDYRPENCKWITLTEQQSNKRNVRKVTHDGETHSITEWARLTGQNRNTVFSRINLLHWSPEKALGFEE